MSAKIRNTFSVAMFVIAVASIAPAAFAQTASDTVSFVNFENREVGVYGNAEAKEDFKRNDYDKSWWYAMDKNNGENSKVVYDGEEHGKVLQLKYPKGCVGPNDNDTPACAAQIIQPLVKTADTMWSAYDIFFEDGFEFQLGGKLPGLCGGKCYTGNAANSPAYAAASATPATPCPKPATAGARASCGAKMATPCSSSTSWAKSPNTAMTSSGI